MNSEIDRQQILAELKAIGEKEKLLLVEDNPVNQQIALAFLEKAGLSADVANNGVQALQAVEKRDYALVLMDIQMPIMDGLTAAREIRAKSDLPVIALTAQALKGDRELCLSAGMCDYISKPIVQDHFYQTLHRRLCPPAYSSQSSA